MKLIPTLMIQLFISLTVVIAALFLVPQPPQVVSFDLQSTLDSYQDQLLDAGMDDERHREELKKFDSKLRVLLRQYSQERNVVIVVPAAVISGATNKTTDIQRFVIEALKTSP